MPKQKQSEDVKTQVVNLFSRAPSMSVKFNLILKKLSLNTKQKSKLRDVLRELVESQMLSRNGKYFQLNKPGNTGLTYQGTVVLDDDEDFAVGVSTESGTERIKIRKKYLSTALINDKVEVSIVEYADSQRKEAVVEKIVERGEHRIIGKLQYAHGKNKYAFVLPTDKKFRKDIYIPKEEIKTAKDGDKVICDIVRWEYQDISPEGKIIEILGKSGEAETEFKALIKKYNLTKTFPKKVNAEVESVVKKLSPEKAVRGGKKDTTRLDLRNEIIFTIDPVNAKDFDDAVSIEVNQSGNYVLGVHIADVSHYIQEGSETDAEALKRGTSVYLMNDVVPMLPEKLSNDICSLKEGVDRLTFSVIMEIDPHGEVIDYKISKSVINSKKRFTYEEVQKIIDESKGKFVYEIQLMHQLHKVLFKRRIREGSLDFQTQEVITEFDKDGSIKSITPKPHLDSMRMIEDFMLLANKCATLFILKQKTRLPFIYRVHDLPDKKRIKELAYFVKQFGISLNPESKASIQAMLELIKGRAEEYLINDITIRSMAKAIYSEQNIGHFGLGFKHYTHFTSPIRRYPDLVVHRILGETLKGISGKRISHYREMLPEICRHSSDTEANAVRAEREAVKILQIQFIEKHLGEVFSGVISGITEYGLYIEITENLIEGMVRLRDLHDDYYILDERNFQLIGRHRKKRYRIGDKVKVRVSKIDKDNKWLDFVLVT